VSIINWIRIALRRMAAVSSSGGKIAPVNWTSSIWAPMLRINW
jgi:hypothetical protein